MGIYRVKSENNALTPKRVDGAAGPAESIIYDNTSTGLPANVGNAIDKTNDNISTLNSVELTNVAVHTHAAGTYFMWVGQLVVATDDIDVGDTIADTGAYANVESTSIVNVLSELNSNLTPLIQWKTIPINIGILQPQEMKYDQVHSFTGIDGYISTAITGFGMTGEWYTEVNITKIALSYNTITWSVQNLSNNHTTGNIYLTIGIMFSRQLFTNG